MKNHIPLSFIAFIIVLSFTNKAFSQNYQFAFPVGGFSNDIANKVYTDNKGFVYIAGSFSGTVDFDPSTATANLTSNSGSIDMFVAKYTPDGKYLWAFNVGGIDKDETSDIKTDANGNVIITGFFRGANVDFDPSASGTAILNSNGDAGPDPGYGGDIFVAKYTSDGKYIWAFNMGGSQLYDNGISIVSDASNNIYVGGYFRENIDFDPSDQVHNLDAANGTIFLAKYSAAGEYQWAFNYGGGNLDGVAYALKMDKQNNLIVTGFYQGNDIDFDPSSGTALLSSNGSYEIYIAKYDASGNYKWAHSMGGTGLDVGRDIALDDKGDIYFTGYFQSTDVDFDPSAGSTILSASGIDPFVSKFSSDGKFLWAKSFTGPGNDYGAGISIINKNLYLSGSFQLTSDFNPDPVQINNLTSNGGLDIYLAKLDTSGNYICAFNIGNSGDEQGLEVATDLTGNIFVTGYFSSSVINFNPGTAQNNISNNGGNDIFLAKYTWPDNPILPKGTISGNSICPGKQAQLTFSSTAGTAPFTIVYTDGVKNYTQQNVISGTPFNLDPNPTVTTTYTLISVKDDVKCANVNNVSGIQTTVNVSASCLTITPSFTSPDTVCVNTAVTIKNTSVGGTSYYWSFCSADISKTPEAVNLGNPGGLLQMPVFTDMVLDNGNYYVFLVNNYPGNLVRLDFGNSMLNTPTAHDLGNFNGIIPHTAEGIQVVKAGGRWQAIIVGGTVLSGGTPRILKIDFGASITNLGPTATNWGNLGNMDEPIDLYLFQDNSNWYGFTVNSSNNTITRFNFGADFNNPPVAVNLGNVGGLNYPTGIYAINDNGMWRVFITSGSDAGTVSRLDFGTSLLNTPTGVNLGSLGGLLKAPRDINIIKDCNGIVGFVVNGLSGANDIVKLNFSGGLDKTPTASSLGNLGNLSFPHSISRLFRVGADLYSFITNVNSNTLTRLKFAGCTSSSIPNSAAQNPPAVKYNTPGVYNINLLMDDGLATQSTYCRQVVVLAPPAKLPTADTSFCSGDSVLVHGSSNAQTYVWSTGSKDSSIFVNNTGTYWVDAGYYGCTVRDSILTKANTLPVANAGKDAALCIKDSVSLQASGGITYSWLPGAGLNTVTVSNPKASPAATTNYVVLVTDKNGCRSSDTVTIKVNPLPAVNAGNDVTVCSGNSTTLTATGGTQYTWSPAKGLSATGINNPVASPDTTTLYQVKVTDANSCTNQDSVKVAVISKPVLVIPSPDTSFCSGGSVTLNPQVSNATSVVWTPAAGLSNSSIAQPLARPAVSTAYTITVNNAGNCPASGLIQVQVLPSPIVSTSSDTVICTSGQAQLNASGGIGYSWSPATALSAADIPNPIASPTSTLYYHVQVTGSNSCTQSDSVLITVNPLPVFTLTPASVSICLGDTTVLTAGGGDVYSWNPDPTNTGEPSIGIVPTENTTYQVTITDNTCKVTGSLSSVVTVGVLPVITLTKSNDIDCVIGQAQLTASGGTGYRWYPATGLSNTSVANPLATPIVTTTYHVQVTGNNGCVKEDSIQVKVSNVAGVNGYQLATAFTPNADGINDCFGVRKWGSVNSLEFSVYDRWGVRVFYSNSTDNCWDGTYKGARQPAGTFVYQVKAKTLCGDIYRKGTVVLIR